MGSYESNQPRRRLQPSAAKDIEVIGISPRALDRLADLPFIHRDPFDRLIVATALEEGMTIVTRDSIIPRYDVPTLW